MKRLIKIAMKNAKRKIDPKEVELETMICKSETKLSKLPAWDFSTLRRDSPVGVDHSHAEHWKWILDLFPWHGLISLEEPTVSTARDGKELFRTKREWLSMETLPAAFIRGVTFRPTDDGRYSRAKVPFWVVKSSFLNADQIGRVFRWLVEVCGLQLRCAVSDGNGSLEGWFNSPPIGIGGTLRVVLKQMGIDKLGLGSTEAVHQLPGRWCNGNPRFIVYLSKEVKR